ncbi:putative 39S ribosomal protein L18, mitochondrial [Apostichopus japonicus]|uniref:Large ribosomal subunit protein uL18m n=1 Tax=Stichopus japonicus TaxID=307972 RepID=A0A2G8KN18_STIJA|nr:putative 39S ribosomal protein L18, mitochondrial [Apostichopus japonicus]
MMALMKRLATPSAALTCARSLKARPLLTWSVVNFVQRNQNSLSANSYSTTSTTENEQCERVSENDTVSPEFVNRNPRNLEKMALAYKDKGWYKSHPRKEYWHKLFVKKTSRHVSAWVEHVNGHIPVKASTEEWAIKKHLYSTTDVVARRNLGRVLAQRCLEAGIEYMVCGLDTEELKGEGNKAFYDAMVGSGVTFEEPKPINDFVAKKDYLPENI